LFQKFRLAFEKIHLEPLRSELFDSSKH
jgi:hypothetical protein